MISQYDVKRTIAQIAESLAERFDKAACYSAKIDLQIRESE